MKKIKSNPEMHMRAPEAATPALPLRVSAEASARKLMSQLESERRAGPDAPGKRAVPAGGALVVCADSAAVAALKGRCAAFGIDATTNELISAGLLLLSQQTETALEVALLQSLRADRSFSRRRDKR